MKKIKKILDMIKKYGNVISITFLFLSIIAIFYVLLQNQNIRFLFVALGVGILLVYWRRSYYKEVVYKVLNIINDSEKIHKYIVELVFFGIVIAVIIGLMMLWIIPSPEIKVTCNSVDYPNVELTINNPTKTQFTDFNLLIMDNWINGTIYFSFEKPVFYGISSSLCTINDTSFTEKSDPKCKLPTCPYINNKPSWQTYAINLGCEYIPRTTELTFRIPLYPLGKDGFGRPSPYEKKGLVFIEYWSREQKLTNTFVDCNTEKPLYYAYPVEARNGEYNPATYYFLRNGWGIYSDTLETIVIIMAILLCVYFIYKKKKSKQKKERANEIKKKKQ